MKSILKFLPVALGVLTMASCSNDDFFGSETQKNGKELIPTVENLVNADGGTTRSAWTAGGTYQVSWQENDKFRVYDEAVQAYDIFSRKATGITIDGDADVEAHKYALFPGDQVYYAGWDKNNGVSAVMSMPKGWDYEGAKKATFPSGEKMVYASDLPMWGDVNNETSENLEVDLKFLTSVLDVCVYQNATKKIRVVAYKDKASLNGLATFNEEGNVTADGAATANLNNLANVEGKQTPLSGYFFAQLKDGGQLVKDMTQPGEMTAKYGYTLEIEVGNTGDEAHVLIPIIPATYEYLSVQYLVADETHTNAWKELMGYEKTEIKRGQVRKTGLEIGKAPITAVVSSLEDLNNKLNTICTTADFSGRTVNITASDDIKTLDGYAHLDIPTGMLADQIVNFNFPIDDTDNPLTIQGGTVGKTMTINLNQGISGNTAVTISTTGKLVLTGSITSSREDQYKKINVTNAQALTFGSSADFNSFSTNMDIVSGKDLTIDAVEGEIANVVLSGTAELTVKSGKVTKVASASSGAMVIAGGEVTTIEKTHKEGDVTIGAAKVGTLEAKTDASEFTTTINGGEVTNLKLAKSTGNVSITDAAVASLETAATGDDAVKIISTNANATVTTLKLNDNAKVTLTGDTEGDEIYTAKIGTLDANTKVATVSSTGKSVISTVSKLGEGSTFTSGWNATKIATSDITGGNIYTAAQLAGIKANTAYTLKTTITSTANWTPVNLSGNFTADKLTVTVKGAPLFNKISGTAVIGGKDKDNFMTLATGNITGAKDENNLGSLAKEVDGTVTVKFVKANTAADVTIQGNAEDGQNKAENIGGLIGKANGTVTLQDVQIGAGEKTVTLKGHANVGGFIGNVAGGTVKILTSEELVSNVAFGLQGTYTEPTDAKAGTFGNFIGSITGAGANVTIGGTTNAKGSVIAKFVNNAINTAGTNNLGYNKNTNGTKKFVGMVGTSGYSSQALTYEIGYSPVTAIGTILLYNKTTDTLGNPVSIKLDDINQFE